MRKSAIISIIVLATVAAPWAASAENCEYHNFRLDYGSFAFLDVPLEDYDVCWEFTKTIGTLNGRLVTCMLYDETYCEPGYCIGRTSDDIWTDGWTGMWARKYYSLIETEMGNLDLREWSWIDSEFRLETGISKVIGGTGAFEEAFGAFSYFPGSPGNPNLFRYKGYVCTL